MHIRNATSADISEYAQMRHELWPHHSLEELTNDLPKMLSDDGLIAVAEDTTGALVGLVEISIRQDYVEGSSTSPVPYLEGWYVSAKLRGQGVGRKLLQFAEQWARDAGYREFASDADVDNTTSIAAHKAIASGKPGEPFTS